MMISTDEIKKIIEQGETIQVEFKSQREKNIDFAKEITAFANGSGGYLLVKNKEILVESGVNVYPTIVGALLFAHRDYTITGIDNDDYE